MGNGETETKSAQEWVEKVTIGDGAIRVFFAKGGWGEDLGQRRTIVDLGDGRILEILVTSPPGYGEHPETIVIGETVFTFVQTDEDRMATSRPYYYSLQSDKGDILVSSRGEQPDFALAVELLGGDSGSRRKIETELVKKAGYHLSGHYSYSVRALEAIKKALG